MKNTIIIVIVLLLLNTPLFAQEVEVIANRLPGNNYSQLKKNLRPEKNNHDLFSPVSKTIWNSKRFHELYDQQHPADNKATAKRTSFMDGSSVSTRTFIESSNNRTFQRYSPVNSYPSSALEFIGTIGAVATSFLYPQYDRSYYKDGSAVQAYLQSTYHQHDK